MTKILDAINNPEDRKEIDTQREADDVSGLAFLLTAENKPGAWIKKYAHRFKHLMDFKSRHFNGRLK